MRRGTRWSVGSIGVYLGVWFDEKQFIVEYGPYLMTGMITDLEEHQSKHPSHTLINDRGIFSWQLRSTNM